MNHKIIDAYVLGEFFLVCATVEFINEFGKHVSTVKYEIPPAYIKNQQWNITTDIKFNDVRDELVDMFKHNWTEPLVRSYKMYKERQIVRSERKNNHIMLSPEEIEELLANL